MLAIFDDVCISMVLVYDCLKYQNKFAFKFYQRSCVCLLVAAYACQALAFELARMSL